MWLLSAYQQSELLWGTFYFALFYAIYNNMFMKITDGEFSSLNLIITIIIFFVWFWLTKAVANFIAYHR